MESLDPGDEGLWDPIFRSDGNRNIRHYGIRRSMHFHAQNVFNRLDLSSYLSCDSCVHEFL
jgi:hypothetical protein